MSNLRKKNRRSHKSLIKDMNINSLTPEGLKDLIGNVKPTDSKAIAYPKGLSKKQKRAYAKKCRELGVQSLPSEEVTSE